jgi:arylsulfatase
MYIKDRKLCYVNNFIGIDQQHFVSSEEVSTGDHTVAVEFNKTSENPKYVANGTLTMSIDKKTVANGKMRTQPGKFAIAGEGLTIGRARADAVSSDYKPPFEFEGGIIKNVVIRPMGADVGDAETEAKMKFSAA